MIHTYHSTLAPPKQIPRTKRDQGWFEMAMTLERYAKKNGYILAANFGRSPFDTHYYYVRTGFPESADIVAGIRDIDYYWAGDNFNFIPLGADLSPALPNGGVSGH